MKFFNLLIACLFVTVSSVSFAQGQVDADQVANKSVRVNKLIQKSVYDLNQAQLKKVNRLLTEIRKTIKSNPGGGQQEISAKGSFNERYTFDFRGKNLREILIQCVDFYNNRSVGDTDEIHISVDFGRKMIIQNNDGYWETGMQACNQIVAFAVDNGVSTKTGHKFEISGSVETDFEFILYGQSKSEVYDRCQDFYYDSDLEGKYADELFISNNFGLMKRVYNRAGAWENADDLCYAIVNEIKI